MTDIKFCGLRSQYSVEAAVWAGSTALGFIFAKSKRQVAAHNVKHWLTTVDTKNQRTVAVFVDPSLREISQVLQQVPFDVIQLHGDEPPEFLASLKMMTGTSIIKAFRHQPQTLDEIKRYAPVVDGFLIDAGTKAQKGGTGRRFDWRSVPDYIRHGRELEKPLWIAGGVTTENVSELLRLNPDGIDVSSGIETDGKKDLGKMNKIAKLVNQHEYHLSR